MEILAHFLTANSSFYVLVELAPPCLASFKKHGKEHNGQA